MNETSFGAWLRRLRRSRDLTQEALAEQAGCAVDTLRAIENERRRPSRELAEILAQRLAVPETERAAFVQLARHRGQPAPSPAPPVPLALPAATSGLTTIPLIGRAAELAVLAALLADTSCRLITIIGPGGIGKSSLAAQAAATCAAQFPDGVLAIALAAAADATAAVSTMAHAMGTSVAGSSAEAQIVAALALRRSLLLLDNLEHLLGDEGLITLIQSILDHAPGVQLLATSRQPLRLRREQIITLDGLSLPDSSNRVTAAPGDAVLLFVERARRLRHDFALGPENQSAITQICRQLDGMPLAVELAAAWTPLLSCAEIAQELTRSLDVLASDERDLPVRHRSLRAVFTSSWQLLAADQQQALARLALFRGGFTREAADQVAQAGLPQLAALGRASLLRREGRRYTLHEMTRQYAAEQLAARPDDHAATVGRFRTHYASLLQDAVDSSSGGLRPEVRETLLRERDNLQAAWGYAVSAGDAQALTAMTRGLWWLYDIQGWHEAGAALFHQAAEGLESSGETALRGRMLAQEGYFVGRLGRHQIARPLLDQALALLAGTADPSVLAEATFYRAMSAFHLGELGSARDLFHRASALAEGDEQPLLQLWVAYYSGLLALWAGEYEAAEQTFTATARSWAELGFRRGQAANLMMRGAALRLADRRDEALLPLRVSLQAAALAHDQTMIGMGFAQLGGLALDRGEYDAAQYLLSESVETLRGLVDPWILGRSLALLVRTEVARDDMHAARQAGAELLRCARASEALLIGEALYSFALIRQREGASGEALALLNALESGPADEDTRQRAIRLQAHVVELLTPVQRAAAELGAYPPPLAWLERISAEPPG